ncbi:hypothetical protein A1O3_02221 [Capronia epimyces CBS 606.96]|uniref:Mitotic checkpoint regulator, MAD2B-interacting-domain-containing protein n=1 Tax=Capronia epimyces CBS 606.96 TaxID=1182542 RepID=W9Y8H6_9EURO|nr:uncharacterized protein A1O3_02221 [Capronia epimyces CBS 606.96]EXJ89157.1 hypothetical protein A1O3_02221 [Capronia epimyces CBS 606.96]
MALVAYSDSEGSDDEQPQPQTKAEKPASKTATTPSNVNFTVNKANPRKIQVKLNEVATNGEGDGEPAPKRPRVGGGGFNAMLPAPKRDNEIKTAPTATTRKVFSLRTGAEPAFSRESDAELRHLFAEQETDGTPAQRKEDDTISPMPKRASPTADTPKEQPVKGNPFMFKPLSVARSNKKPKRKADASRPASSNAPASSTAPLSASSNYTTVEPVRPDLPPKKVSLFSITNEPETVVQVEPRPDEDEIVEVLDEPVSDETYSTSLGAPTEASSHAQPQSLDTIASDLNLSKADRRQLFGRRGQGTASAINVVNFNTDQEYAANEALRASGEQAQHNPVRTIAPGKHSLKQLVTAATGQKEALEESFATGRRNRKEAGSKYGW